MKQRRSLRAFSRVLPKCSFGTGRTCKSSAHNRQEEVPETEKADGQGGNGNGKGKSGSSGGGSYPEGSGKYYNYYCAYLSHLSAQNLDNVFFSNSSEWTAIREQMRQRLGNELYELIMNRFVPQGK